MEHIVSGCKDCPFRDEMDHDIYDEEGDWGGEYTTHWCTHPKMKLQDIRELEGFILTPSNFPLYKESVTITIKQY